MNRFQKLLRKFDNWLGLDDQEDDQADEPHMPTTMSSRSARRRMNSVPTRDDSSDLNSQPLRVSIFKANGGWVMETNKFNHQTGDNVVNLYVINSGDTDALAERMAELLTFDMVSRV